MTRRFWFITAVVIVVLAVAVALLVFANTPTTVVGH